MPRFVEGNFLPPKGRFAICVSRFNSFITEELVKGAVDSLVRHGVGDDDIDVYRCPGTFELPPLVKRVAESNRYAGVIALGCVIRGDTIHFEIVSQESSRALMDLAVMRKLPLGNGILTVNTEAQAWARARASELNKGGDAARAALAMLRIKRRLAQA